jgi:hypothetical protein
VMQKIETNQLLEKILDELQSLSKKIDELSGAHGRTPEV